MNKMIYIDELIILNFIIDFLILKTTSSILKLNTKTSRLIISSIAGEISLLYLFINFNNIELTLFKLSIGVIMNLISFGYINLKDFIKNLLYFYMFSFFLGGTLYYLKIESLVKYKYYLLLIPIIMNILKKLAYNLKNIIKLRHKVTIYLKNGNILYLNGYMDTGNTLVEPYTNKNVIIINKDIKEKFFLVPFKTIENSSLLKCFKPKKVYIDGIGERNDIVVGVTNKKFNGFNCLLNYNLMEE